ncbi:hydrogenase maturation protease [candidate division FCPU426 bacterium]|nr:hydrogenase maturation protease [candidate division FCPU426 bacterium]
MAVGHHFLILGLGNPLLTDDTIGLLAVQKAEADLSGFFPQTVFKSAYQGTFDLLHELAGFSHAIIIDSICTGHHPPGFCHQFTPADLAKLTHACLVNWHSLNLPTLLQTGQKCGFPLPREILLFAVEGTEFTAFSEEPTPEVKKAIDPLIQKIARQLQDWHDKSSLCA